jgi:hypothetical protein
LFSIFETSVATPLQLNVIGGQHGRRDITETLLLPFLRRCAKYDTIGVCDWFPTSSCVEMAVVVCAYNYCVCFHFCYSSSYLLSVVNQQQIFFL